MDVAELAAATRIEVSSLQALLAGKPVQLSTAALARIARRLGLPATTLWSDDPGAEVELALRFRHASVPDFNHNDTAIAERAILVARALDELDALLGRQRLRTWFSVRRVGSPAHEDGYSRAREVRRVLAAKGVVARDSAPLPDDLDRAVEDEFGIPIIEDALATSSVLALTAKDRATEAVAIVLNGAARGVSIWRRRVDIAHELSHALFDAAEDALTLWIDREEDEDHPDFPADGHDPAEQRARAFAAELLVPRTGLRELLGPPPSMQASLTRAVEMVKSVRDHFQSPTELTAYHLANNGYFPKFLHEQVVKTAPAMQQLPPGSRVPVLTRRAREAVDAQLLTEMAAREILGLSAWEKLPWT